jgi:hypothetical protein
MKKPNAPNKPGGPFLAAAVFCDNILEEMGGVVTAYRIVDSVQGLIAASAPPDLPSKKNPIEFRLNMLLVFRSGDSPGKHKLKLVVESPLGKRKTMSAQEIELSPEPQGGINFKSNFVLRAYSNGMFWVDVILDGKRLTRMPLSVAMRREGETGPPVESATKKQIKK